MSHHDESAAHAAEHGHAEEGHAKEGAVDQHDHKSRPKEKKAAWAGRITWAGLNTAKDDDAPALKLESATTSITSAP